MARRGQGAKVGGSTGPQGPRVFISYRRQDCAGYARLLCDRLRARFGRDRVFIDVDTIQPGTDFVEAIEDAIGKCNVLVAMIGQRWLTAATPAGRRIDEPQDYVRIEISTALEREIAVVPVLVEGAGMPTPQELPAPLAKLSRRNALSLSDTSFDDDVERLTKTLERLLRPSGDRPPTRPAMPGMFTRRRVTAAAVVAAMAVIASLIVAITRRGDTGPPQYFSAGTTMRAIQERGYLRVGIEFDKPGLGRKKELSEARVEGFDADIAKFIAVGLFGGTLADVEDKIDPKEAKARDREGMIQSGDVDIVVATYTITDERKKIVDFAGPYLVAHQDIMVKAGNTAIKGVPDLNGKKVCSVEGSTSLTNLLAKAPRALPHTEADPYTCAERLRDGIVEAVTTDDVILAGLVERAGGDFKLVGSKFSEEPYGIGFKKGDKELCEFLSTRLKEIYESREWHDAFERHLGQPSNLRLTTPKPPRLDSPCRGPRRFPPRPLVS